MFKKPYRVETWFERDRSSIVVYDADDREIAEWWDDDVQDMFESGYFTPGRGERVLADSVLGYVRELGLDMPAGLDRAAKMRRVAAKRQQKNPGDVHLDIDIGSHNAAKGGRTSVNPGELRIPYVIQDSDVGKRTIRFQGRTWLVANFMGNIQNRDVGKRIYRVGDILQVENDEQYRHRLVGKFVRTIKNPLPEGFKMTGGDIIKILNREELPQSGLVTATRIHYALLKPAKSPKQIEQIILNKMPYGTTVTSHYSLKPGAYPDVKHAYGMVLQDRPFIKPKKNPPLPASALMDISTAKTVVREVDSGVRSPRPALSQADDLLDRGLQKLRGSHLGNVDWKNPPKGVRWKYEDARGVQQEGTFVDFRDYGGTDVTYFFKRDDGVLDLVSGSRLKKASPIYEKKNPPATEVYRNIVEIKAIKPDGKRYVHKFDSGSHILGLANGDLLIQSRKGKRLWKNFKTGGE